MFSLVRSSDGSNEDNTSDSCLYGSVILDDVSALFLPEFFYGTKDGMFVTFILGLILVFTGGLVAQAVNSWLRENL